MTDLLPWVPPDGVEVLIQWLLPLGEVRDERPAGATLPYRMVHRIPGPSTRLVDSSAYSVHTFAATKPVAYDEAMETHRRILLLAGDFVGQQKVTMHDGQEVYADDVVCTETPNWVQWDAQNTIHRYVATYRIDLRFTAVPT